MRARSPSASCARKGEVASWVHIGSTSRRMGESNTHSRRTCAFSARRLERCVGNLQMYGRVRPEIPLASRIPARPHAWLKSQPRSLRGKGARSSERRKGPARGRASLGFTRAPVMPLAPRACERAPSPRSERLSCLTTPLVSPLVVSLSSSLVLAGCSPPPRRPRRSSGERSEGSVSASPSGDKSCSVTLSSTSSLRLESSSSKSTASFTSVSARRTLDVTRNSDALDIECCGFPRRFSIGI